MLKMSTSVALLGFRNQVGLLGQVDVWRDTRHLNPHSVIHYPASMTKTPLVIGRNVLTTLLD